MTSPTQRTRHVVAVSGGKDSTALALRLAELNPETDYTYLITPTGNEPPEMFEHWRKLEGMLRKPFIRLKPIWNSRKEVVGCDDGSEVVQCLWRRVKKHRHPIRSRVVNVTGAAWKEDGLHEAIRFNGVVPNFRMRWCTRQLKIEPTLAWLFHNAPCVQYVGLRADEEHRGGIYGSRVEQRYPFREWGWGLNEVNECNERFGVDIPERTDCDDCFHQRLPEWWWRWKHRPESHQKGEALEEKMGHTFRSPGRDTWPLPLVELGLKFEQGHKPRGVEDRLQGRLFENCDKDALCRVCTL